MLFVCLARGRNISIFHCWLSSPKILSCIQEHWSCFKNIFNLVPYHTGKSCNQVPHLSVLGDAYFLSPPFGCFVLHLESLGFKLSATVCEATGISVLERGASPWSLFFGCYFEGWVRRLVNDLLSHLGETSNVDGLYEEFFFILPRLIMTRYIRNPTGIQFWVLSARIHSTGLQEAGFGWLEDMGCIKRLFLLAY